MASRYFPALGMAAMLALAGCASQQGGAAGGAMASKSGGQQGEAGAMAHHCPMHGGKQGGQMACPMGAQGGHHGQHGHHHMHPGAMAKISPTQGNQVTGVATFYEMEGQTALHVRLTGLKPNAEHGFHIHERGDCSAPDATSAGGHFNPAGKPHGPQDGEHHAGDLPNLKANAQGNAEMRLKLPGLTLSRGETSILDRAVVVHAQPDDYRSQPAGNAGPRIACGVISAAVPPPR